MSKVVKFFSLLLTILILVSSTYSITPAFAAGTKSENTTGFSDQELNDNDYILYFVNAGDPTPSTVEGIDKMGLYASKTEQMYGADPVTGKKWGLVTTTSNTTVNNAENKYGSLRYYNGPQIREKALNYKFELPDGEYDLTLGFKNPWSGRSVNIFGEGQNLSNGDFDIGSYSAEKEVTYQQVSVTDGELDVAIQGPSTASLTNYNDPLVNYIIVKKYIIIPLSDLEAKINTAKVEAEKTDTYTKVSLDALKMAIEQADALVKEINDDNLDITTKEIQTEIRAKIKNLETSLAGLALNIPNESFKPGEVWRDTNGAVIQAHGGGIMYDEETKKYFWYGEDKTNGYLPARGVRVYSSTDLYNWKDEGLALTAIESMEQFASDPLISKLYEGRTDKADILNDIGTDRVIERPKVIYNEKTKKYVMWMHTDGPSETSNAIYAKAEAGYALSDSPTGPFIYQESNRMDRAPEDAEYNGQPNQPGMARDMNLFKDDDGTAYLIYSSEENMTIYISKLNESYTDVVGWHRDGNVERDTTYKAVYGEDYVRVFPGAQREAPAMFKYNGKYYMITSGATGWAPNPARFTVADEIFGEWKPLRDPAVGEKSSTTFDSQSTNVIPVDPEKGKFIFMGDRWNSSKLQDSRYVWLPIEFGQDDEIILQWYDEWKLDILDRMGRVTINTELPEKVAVDQLPKLPNVIQVTNSEGNQLETPVSWEINAEDFAKPGTVIVEGTLSELANKVIRTKILVIPDHVTYFVHAGGAETSDYKLWSSYMQKTLINKEIIDQKYDPENGQSWGYVGDRTKPAGSEGGDLFSALRYLLSGSGDDLSYKFDLKNGKYTVYTGLYDPWYTSTRGSRKADILLNGETKTKGYVFTDSYDVLGYNNVNITDGKLDLTVRRVPGSPDPQISWIMIVEEDTTAPTGDFTINSGAEFTNDQHVNLSLNAEDDLSGVNQARFSSDSENWTEWDNYASSKDFVLPTGDGEKTIFVQFKDNAENISPTYQKQISLDTNGPVIEFSGNEETYTVDSKVAISCRAVDELSGIANAECPTIEGPAYNFTLGENKISATATDNAGNKGEVEATFTVTVDFNSLSHLTEEFVNQESIAHSLTTKLLSAEEAAERGNTEAMEGKIKAYINQLSAQSGKSILNENADLLISLSNKLK
ncbi:family 43 glycosylhydrolase [Metabacillus bambusae]|uniref:Family 43 glycosylhydrolase n=1 Tax=Metabacillus bambusae TaxID=2795218 RepID=A0ABS3MXE4_9BACI|nr:family 43 glycosylhydrolase [Metabacillus bambusae]MBO1510692.1 family 43 glycosylhydrolase [Metabacillus bambusae]